MSATHLLERPADLLTESTPQTGEAVRHALLDFYVSQEDGPAIVALSPQRQRVIQMLVDGRTYNQIAGELGIAKSGALLMAQRCVQLLTEAREQRRREYGDA